MTHLTEDQMREALLSAVRQAGTQKAWATANGISPAYVNDCLNRGKPIGAGIAAKLGYCPATVYVPIDEDSP